MQRCGAVFESTGSLTRMAMPCLRLSILIPLFFCLVLPLRAQEKPLPVLPQKHTPHRANVLELNRPAERLMTPRPAEWEAEFNRAHSAFRSGVSFLEAKARVDRVLRALPDDAQARKLRAQILIALN